MSKARVKSSEVKGNSWECFTWNSCEDKLRECIGRNKFVKEVRNKLAKNRIKKLKKISG